MKLSNRLAMCVAALAFVVAVAPELARAACSAGGTVANVNDCVAAGKGSTDCFLEWAVTPQPPADPKNPGFPVSKIICADNDPACDADTTPGQCTFKVGICVNVADARLSGCMAQDATTTEVKKPSAKDVAKPQNNPFTFDNRDGLLKAFGIAPTATSNVCSDQRKFVVPLKKGTKKNNQKIQGTIVSSTEDKDKDSLQFTCLPNPATLTQAIASAKQITVPSELIGGPLAMGQVGDWLLENDKARFIIRDVGRDFSFMLTFGGHLIDADYRRDGEPGRDNFLAMTPLINISSTDHPTSIAVVNSGSLGGPAVLSTSGPDDLFDPIDPWVAIEGFSTSFEVPASARDNNIDVTVVNEYTLEPGDEFLKIETIVTNEGAGSLNLYMGDFTAGGGQLEFVSPSLGFGESAIRLGGISGNPFQPITYDYLGWVGFGEAAGVAYGLIPKLYDATTSFAQSGVTVPVYGQSVLNVLLGQEPGVFAVAPTESTNVVRWFTLSDNGTGRILDARHKLIARGEIAPFPATFKTGYVQGTVTVGGQPVESARVSITRVPGNYSSFRGLVASFDTNAGGFYQGTLPQGEYRMQVRALGYAYENGGATPLIRVIKIGGGTRVENFELPPTGFVKVNVTNGVSMDPIAAKVSVVGLQATPEAKITEIAGDSEFTGQVFGYDAREKEDIYGLPQVQFTNPTSGATDVFPLQPGDYEIVVSHGPEFSVFRQPITVTAGTVASPQVVNATVVRVVDTTGFVSSDQHVHMINSPDSTVSKEERIVTMLAEGVDHFVATDHDFVTDLAPEVTALGVSSLIKTTRGDEMTYFDSGHFNAYPLDTIPGSVTNGAVDWGREGEPPGSGYPSDGSYDLSVSELGVLAKGAPHNAIVFQANHFNSGTLGYFRLIGLNSTMAPPQSSTPAAILRQDPAITNLYSDELTALEIWIESSRSQNALATGENFGDWFNMLNNFSSANPLLRKAAVCDSDTHSTTIVQAGGPRTMIASATDDPSLLDSTTLANAINDGRSVCTSGPFMRVEVVGDGLATASHAIGDPLIVPATGGSATVNVNIQSPTWAEFDQVQFFVRTVPSCSPAAPSFLGGVKNVCTPTAQFTQQPIVPAVVPINGSSRLEADVSQVLTITQDSWVVVVVRGSDGISKPLFPMNPQSILRRGCSLNPCRPCLSNGQCNNPNIGNFGTCTVLNQTTAELADGNLGQCGVTTLAFSNPIFIDFDGDGFYQGAAVP